MAPTPIRRPQTNRSSDRRQRRKPTPCQRSSVFYVSIVVFFIFITPILTRMLNMMPGDPKDGSWPRLSPATRRPPPGRAVRFRPLDLLRRLEEQGKRLDRLRSERRTGVRPPRLALVFGKYEQRSTIFDALSNIERS